VPSPSAPTPPAIAATGRPGLALIALTCLGSGMALAAGRQLLLRLAPALTPLSSPAQLERARHWSVDPSTRRDAALLLSAQAGATPQRKLQWLRGQGWGQDPLAAVALKQAALAAEASQRPKQADQLWQQLWRRFPRQAASADALYALGRNSPAWRAELLRRFPAHPAALAAAVESDNAVHLAQWGPRWPGAEPLLRQACAATDRPLGHADRQRLAGGLAQLGDGAAAQRCLGPTPATRELQLSLARALLKGPAEQATRGEALLLRLAQRWPRSAEAQEAVALLAQQQGPQALALLRQLPASLQDTAAVQARLALERQRPWQAVLQRWPRDPASWDLQWDLARAALLQRQWARAAAILASLNSRDLPLPLAARQLFWQGYSAQRQGQTSTARERWEQLLQRSRNGYYGWRAAVRLGQAEEIDPRRSAPANAGEFKDSPAASWQPLESGAADLDALWRVGHPLEAWEAWRHRQGGGAPHGGQQLLVEGRLRLGVGDDWIGLGQLEQASLRLPQASCAVQRQRDQQLHPRRFSALFEQAARRNGIDPALLLGVAKQESRFTAGVESPVGAVGLLQLMPATAAELAGQPQPSSALKDPGRNALLGARYLRQLLDQWQGQSFLAVASYNAGAGAVGGWLTADRPDPRRESELWTEAIPYPETRLYTKKVLGNLWTYRQLEQPGC